TGRSQQQFISDPQALNFYSYSRGNPLRYTDHKGLWYKEFLTGQQSWPSFQLELGDASNQLAELKDNATPPKEARKADGAATFILGACPPEFRAWKSPAFWQIGRQLRLFPSRPLPPCR